MRLCFKLILVAVIATFVVYPPSANARRNWGLFLATSPEDPVLRQRLTDLSPTVSADEARRVVYAAYTNGREMAQKWHMVSSPTFQCFLINIGLRKGGYCYQFATELLLRLNAEKLRTLDLHWAESDAGTDTEHNVILITARGQPFEEGILLDNWRRSGRLLWGPLSGDPDHKWTENRAALESRLKPKRTTTKIAKPSPDARAASR
ncbi:MAG TPA: hypothetical protein VGI85_10690 [Chthoniobacterales bacterium]|jgi:hypothetical protein